MFDDYQSLWRWSVSDLDGFWRSIWDYFDILADGSPEQVLASRAIPGAQWFPGVRLNYAEHLFRNETPHQPALIARSKSDEVQEVTWGELRRQTAAVAAALRDAGVQPGDRVASFLLNCSETIIAFLACASIGAVWSSCGPDMGLSVVLNRSRQIEPMVLLTTDSYRYNDRVHDRADTVEQLLTKLPSVRLVLHVPEPLVDHQLQQGHFCVTRLDDTQQRLNSVGRGGGRHNVQLCQRESRESRPMASDASSSAREGYTVVQAAIEGR